MKAFVLSARLFLTHKLIDFHVWSDTSSFKFGAERRVYLNLLKTNHTCQKSHMSCPHNYASGSPVIGCILSLGNLSFGSHLIPEILVFLLLNISVRMGNE